MLPQLRRLERKWADELVVIGVHSAKFPTEQETANVRQAVMRLSLDHPVVNDAEFTLWQQYAVRAWPTLMFLDPHGGVIGKHEGEVSFDALDRFVADLVRQYDALGWLERGPLKLALERDRHAEGWLRFPGKLLADAAAQRLIVADTYNHKLKRLDPLTRACTTWAGSGEPGHRDGPAAEARFYEPSGVSVAGARAYVADTNNHAVRVVELASGSVTTLELRA